MENTTMKTITAWEVKVGDKIKVRFKNRDYEFEVQWINKYEEDCTVSFWGLYALSFIGASEQVILIENGKVA
jgi:hypothetical protein